MAINIRNDIYFALEKVYLPEFIERTGGKGPIKNSWVLIDDGENFIFRNPNGIVIECLEIGRKKGIIEAKNKKFLRFKKPKTTKSSHPPIPGNVAFEKDGFIFTKKVMHPGYEGRHFIDGILNDTDLFQKFEDVLWERVQQHIQQELDKK